MNSGFASSTMAFLSHSSIEKCLWDGSTMSGMGTAKGKLEVQADLIICGLFISEFTYSHWTIRSKISVFLSKVDLISENSKFVV